MKNLKNILLIIGMGAFSGVFAMETPPLSGTPARPTLTSPPMLSSPEKPHEAARLQGRFTKRKLTFAPTGDTATEPDLASSEAEMQNPSVVKVKLVNQTSSPISLIYPTQSGLSDVILARMGKDGFYIDTQTHLHKGRITASLGNGHHYRLTYDKAQNALVVNRAFSEDPEDSTLKGTLPIPRNRRNLVLAIKAVSHEENPFTLTPE